MHQPSRVTHALMVFIDPLPLRHGPQLPVDSCERFASRLSITLPKNNSNSLESTAAGP